MNVSIESLSLYTFYLYYVSYKRKLLQKLNNSIFCWWFCPEQSLFDIELVCKDATYYSKLNNNSWLSNVNEITYILFVWWFFLTTWAFTSLSCNEDNTGKESEDDDDISDNKFDKDKKESSKKQCIFGKSREVELFPKKGKQWYCRNNIYRVQEEATESFTQWNKEIF